MRSLVLAAVCVVLVALVASGASSSRTKRSLRQEWQAYKREHGKVYETPEEDARRFALFMRSLERIEAFRGLESHQRGLNHLSDWTEEELKQLHGLRLPEGEALPTRADNSPEAEEFLQAILRDPAPVPDQLDWRKVPNRVSGIKDQGHCGSCWIFATTGVLEGQEAVRWNKTKSLVPLSEQELVDCYNINYSGCAGGYVDSALKKVAQMGGLESERDYPYVSGNGTVEKCKFSKSKAVFVNKGVATLPQYDEDNLKEVLAKYGPISVGVEAYFWHDYKGGIYDRPSDGIDHAVLLVGYGTDSKQGDYWIVKNSWGEKWGEQGYIRLRRGDNTSSISQSAMIATF